MSILIILIILFSISLTFAIKLDSWDNEGWKILSTVISSILGIWVIIHIIMWINVPYSYENFKVQRDAFEDTLNESRINGRENESATIILQVKDINMKIAKNKYLNTLWWYDWCIDDRINELEPIK